MQQQLRVHAQHHIMFIVHAAIIRVTFVAQHRPRTNAGGIQSGQRERYTIVVNVGSSGVCESAAVHAAVHVAFGAGGQPPALVGRM
jgi:hypothetical protein